MGNMTAAKKFVKEYYADLAKTLKPYIDLTKYNELYLKVIDSMSAKEFEAWIHDIDNMDRFLEVMIPVSTGARFPEKEVIALTRKYGGEPFTQLRVVDDVTGETYITPEKYWVPLFPKRRQIQTMDSKVSLPESNKVRDNLTGAVTGASKGSSMSAVQTMSMLSRGCMANALELNKARGGDLTASREMNKALMQDGTVSLNQLLKNNSRPESSDTLGIRWNSMHISHTL